MPLRPRICWNATAPTKGGTTSGSSPSTVDQRPAREAVAHREDRERHRDDAADQHREHAGQQGVDEGLAEERAREEGEQRTEGGPAAVEDRHREHLEQRIDDGDREQGQQGRHQRGFPARARPHQADAGWLDSTAGASGTMGWAAKVRYSRSASVCSRRRYAHAQPSSAASG